MITDTITERLTAALKPSSITVENESALHAGHAGYTDGESHFRVTIVCDMFKGCSSVQRHRLVYDAVADLLPQPIHALAIIAKAPEEATKAQLPPAGQTP
jgi:BolA protein